MDPQLRCNNQNGSCRATLADRAVVTTCSHIFCLPCADYLGLMRAAADQRRCPACSTLLPSTDDAVTTVLQPAEDYKTSVLSGLDPTTIVECAGRALAFWSYQTAQEINYQVHTGRVLTDKYTHLSGQLDKIINEANAEIQNLQGQLGNMAVDKKSLQNKNSELVDMYREKTRKHQQTQQLYDALKKRVMMSQVQNSASQNANKTIQSIGGGGRPGTYNGTGIRTSNTHGMITDHGVEQLHTRQRAGSNCSSHGGRGEVAPPNTPMRGHQNPSMATAPPMHRAPLPGQGRATVNRSQIPMSTSRSSYPNPNNSQKAPNSATCQSFSSNPRGINISGGYGMSPNMKIGGTRRNGSFIGRPSTYPGEGHINGNNEQIRSSSNSQDIRPNQSYFHH